MNPFEPFEKLSNKATNIVIVDRKCKLIDGTICDFDLCASTIDAYDDWNIKIKYVGKGIFYSFDGCVSTDNVQRHFWIKLITNE